MHADSVVADHPAPAAHAPHPSHELDEQERHERQDLAVDHLSLVHHIVRETMSRVPAHVSRDDLTSAGFAALVKAANTFEPDRGVPFARYAALRVRGAVLDELRHVDWASRSVRRRSRELEEARSALAADLGRTPEATEVAARLGVSVDEVDGIDRDVSRAQVLSLQANEESSVEQLLPWTGKGPEDEVEHRERLTYLIDAISELPEKLRLVVVEYFIAERPMSEIAAKLGVTESRISQLRAEALVLLRDAMNSALDPALVPAHPRPGGCADQRRQSYFGAVAERHAARRVPARLSESA